MSETIIGVVIGGLVSIFTVLVTKLFDLKLKDKEYEAALKKEYFVKKLAVMEKAVSQWFILVSVLDSTSHFFKLSLKWVEEGVIPEEIQVEISKNIEYQFQKINDSSYDISNAIFLYYDLDEKDFLSQGPSGKFLKILAEINVLKCDLELLYDVRDGAKGTELEGRVEKSIDINEKATLDKIHELSSVLEEIKSTFTILIKETRKDLKKFE
ncbi:hypothetical protein [Tunicatimonas pelagia]|uniref:hypothetical protein n=1 Tax=Tunicatimonas pelagia TaxID=931531 RepID=UPI002666B5C9|nr:hypothetical protein [Tunicatimonas pelagia]WKN43678.1 hypothetical protein P0M28_01675 [Tunicatimonas pelagia]